MCETCYFIEGEFKDREVYPTRATTGTYVVWQPSEEFFTNTIVEIEKVKSLFKTITCLCPGLTISLNDNGKVTEYYSEHGLDDLVDEMVKNKEIITNRFGMKFEQGKEKMDFILTYTSNYSSTLIPYVNTGLTEKGPHITQVKTVLTREFNKFFREKKWLKDKDENLTGDDIQEGMYIVFNLTAPNVSYDAQVKSTITKIDMKSFTQALADNLQIWFNNNEKEIKLIFDKAASARKAREAAKKARDNARNINGKKEKNKLLTLPTKLVDSWSKDRNNCELLICEGDSAATGLIGARDSEFQAIFPIRGKLLNLYKATDNKIFTNQEVVNIIKAIGLDLSTENKKLIFDSIKLRYGKIILCCDGDPDGQAIKNLLLTYFWSLCPELILQGYIYVAVPPLFRITTKKNEYIYLKDSAALEEYKIKHQNESFLVNRNKGLGEQDPEELSSCLLDPSTRNVIQVTVANPQEAEKLFSTFMGPAVPPRREYILQHSEEAADV